MVIGSVCRVCGIVSHVCNICLRLACPSILGMEMQTEHTMEHLTRTRRVSSNVDVLTAHDPPHFDPLAGSEFVYAQIPLCLHLQNSVRGRGR